MKCQIEKFLTDKENTEIQKNISNLTLLTDFLMVHKTHEETRRRYLPLKEAAVWAGVSPRTLRRWFSLGLPVYRAVTGGKRLVRPDDIDEFLSINRYQAQRLDVNSVVDQVFSELVGEKFAKP